MSNNNVINQIEIDGEYKSVIATVPLTGEIDLRHPHYFDTK
jgi:hypothetical protein